MATVGSLGDIITFTVSSERVLTFRDMKRDFASRWAEHNVIGKRPLVEYIGPGLRTITFTIQLNAMDGLKKPNWVIHKIELAMVKGTPMYLIIGGVQIGVYKWIVESMSEAWDKIMNNGKLVSAKVDLTLKEYIR